MSSLVLRPDSDYRVIYLREADFEQRMADVYTQKQTEKGAPFLDDMLVELIDIEAILFLEKARENPFQFGLSESEIDSLEQQIVLEDNLETAYTVLWDRAGRDFIELFQRDVRRYLMDNQISFFETDEVYRRSRQDAVLRNSPIIEVW
jgi:hypothetical protein